jgi:hypothetical protein
MTIHDGADRPTPEIDVRGLIAAGLDQAITLAGYCHGEIVEICTISPEKENGAKDIDSRCYPVTPEALEVARDWLASCDGSVNLYYGSSPIRSDVVARLKTRPSDLQVAQARAILIDVDPEDSSLHCRAVAAVQMDSIRSLIREIIGIDLPLVDSGRGRQTVMRHEPWLPETAVEVQAGRERVVIRDARQELRRRVLHALAAVADRDGAHVDTSTCNPSRLMRLPGGTNLRTGQRARVVEIGDGRVITMAEMSKLADALEARAPGRKLRPKAKARGIELPTSPEATAQGSPQDDDVTFIRSHPLLLKIWDTPAVEGDDSRRDASLAIAALRAGADEQRVLRLLRTLPGGDAAEAGDRQDDLARRALAWAQRKLGKTGDCDGSEPDSESATQGECLVDILGDAELFRSPAGRLYVRLQVGDHREVWSISGESVGTYLSHLHHERTGNVASSRALSDAVRVLRGRALFGPDVHEVHVRVAREGEAIYLDLGDASWRAVEITAAGWRVVDQPPVRFRRPAGMLALPEPVAGGSLDPLWDLTNLPEEHGQVLLSGWLVGALRDRGPYLILVLQGEQGSAKTFLCRVVSSIIDPRTAGLRALPREERDLAIACGNGWLVGYDNLSGLSPWIADGMCRVSTGGGFATRRLYTDDDEALFDTMRPIVVNGIDDLLTRADLADRAVVLHLPMIPEQSRRPERRLWTEFLERRPLILGALLDAVSMALRRIGDVSLERLPRMADVAEWVTAAEPALGLEDGEFVAAYLANRSRAVEQTVEADVVGGAVLALVAAHATGWTGTATQLQARLASLVSEHTHRSRDWPLDPQRLANRLRRLAPALRAMGITLDHHRTSGGDRHRTWTIRRP